MGIYRLAHPSQVCKSSTDARQSKNTACLAMHQQPTFETIFHDKRTKLMNGTPINGTGIRLANGRTAYRSTRNGRQAFTSFGLSSRDNVLQTVK
uniref:Uncharacterized protein n=1 Tax=Parascaris equorum TaxID=6256 RepID=A0A914S475_PAREQ